MRSFDKTEETQLKQSMSNQELSLEGMKVAEEVRKIKRFILNFPFQE